MIMLSIINKCFYSFSTRIFPKGNHVTDVSVTHVRQTINIDDWPYSETLDCDLDLINMILICTTWKTFTQGSLWLSMNKICPQVTEQKIFEVLSYGYIIKDILPWNVTKDMTLTYITLKGLGPRINIAQYR